MKRLPIFAAVLALMFGCSPRQQSDGPRIVEDFNFGWKFTLGDSPDFNLSSEEDAEYRKQLDAEWEIQRAKLIEQQKQQIKERLARMRNNPNQGSVSTTIREPSRPRDPHGTKFTEDAQALWASPEFDDSGWRDLHLPHDWAIEGTFDRNAPSGTGGGALPGGIGWYRKHFVTPAGDRTFVEFDGVFMNSTVYVNGRPVGTRPYGYSSFTYDITGFLNPEGEDNVIAVRCDNADQPNSRWYAGCGIYRNVRLVTVANQHIAYSGTYVTTPEISDSSAKIVIESTVENNASAVEATITHKIKDAKGKYASYYSEKLTLAAGNTVSSASLNISDPHLWSVDDPYLYEVETTIEVGDSVIDNYSTTFGVRYIDWDAEKGFFLNGQPLKLLGVCLHHDMGCIGSAVHYRALERELGILKDMGCNAIRTSHNPPAPELLEICDRMGFVVMDEAFDMWRKRKTTYDYSRFFEQWHVRDVEDFIKRDRNHPSIIMWSLANEIGEQGDSREDILSNLSPAEANILLNFIESIKGDDSDPDENNPNILLTRHMAKIVRDLDDTRYISAGCNNVSPNNNLFRSGALDAYGFNYHPSAFDDCHEWFAGVPMFGSETASAINSRGIYRMPSSSKEKHPSSGWSDPDGNNGFQCTAYDSWSVPWGNLHEEAWITVRDRDFIAGTFVWTGFDYLGEPTPYGWPARSSYFGIVDLAGFPKDQYYMYQSEWTDKTMLHLYPHWNWKEGDKVDIWANYNNADEVELFVNGKSLGRKSKTSDVLHVEWLEVPFEPGKIEAVSYKGGKEVAREVRETPGQAVAIRLTPDRRKISADGYDLCYVTAEAVDSKGRTIDNALNMLHFEVEGAGELFGVDNGDATGSLSLKGNDMPLFSGKALAVVRSIKDQPGTATLTVTSDLGSTTLKITAR